MRDPLFPPQPPENRSFEQASELAKAHSGNPPPPLRQQLKSSVALTPKKPKAAPAKPPKPADDTTP